MANPAWTMRLGATPGKLALVVLLAMALLAALLFPSGESAELAGLPEPGQAPRPRTAEPASEVDTLVAEPLGNPVAERNRFPRITVEEALAYDPFAPVPALVEETEPADSHMTDHAAPAQDEDRRREQIERTVASLRDAGVRIVLVAGGKQVALVGDRQLRVGDWVDGLQVTAITPHGITLDRVDEPRP